MKKLIVIVFLVAVFVLLVSDIKLVYADDPLTIYLQKPVKPPPIERIVPDMTKTRPVIKLPRVLKRKRIKKAKRIRG